MHSTIGKESWKMGLYDIGGEGDFRGEELERSPDKEGIEKCPQRRARSKKGVNPQAVETGALTTLSEATVATPPGKQK